MCSQGRGREYSQGAECESEGRGAARAQGRCVNSGVSRVCAHACGRAGARRCAVREVAGPGKGAVVLCAWRWCASAALGCKRAECAGPRVPGAGRGTACVRALGADPRGALGSARCILTRGAAALPGADSGSRVPARGSRPAFCSAHAPAPSPAARGNATPAVSPGARLGAARCGSGALPGRGGGRELRRSPGTLPGARRALPRAHPPARSLFNLK